MAFLPGLSEHHRLPRGMDRRFQIQQLRPFAAQREAWWINRRPGLGPGVTMADLADDYAEALRSRFSDPLDIVGVSTGGSVALQLAADHPDLVRRLVLVSSACRLGVNGREAQRRVAAGLRAGHPRRAAATALRTLAAGPVTARMLALLGLAFPSLGLGNGEPDLLATIDAEDGFDLRDRLGEITAPTLVIGGSRDAFYGAELFRETASLIPGGQLSLYDGKGHLGTQQGQSWTRDALAFLTARG